MKPQMEDTKTCFRCKEEKPRTADFFWKSKQTKDGLYSYCKSCSSTVHKGFRKKESAKKVAREYHASYRKLARQLVLNHYSNGDIKCACCGERREEFLSIDHINGGGHQHRKQIGQAYTYRWLVRHNYPEGFRVLCMNCNHSLGIHGYCPHEKEKKLSV